MNRITGFNRPSMTNDAQLEIAICQPALAGAIFVIEPCRHRARAR